MSLGACRTAQDLTVKFISHQGEFSFIRVKDFNKPHGSDVVLVHKLLKNDVPGREYILATDGLLDGINSNALKQKYPWINIESGFSQYENVGLVEYGYISLESLNKRVQVKPSIFSDLSPDPIIIEGTIDLDASSLFELVTNFDFRDQWNNAPLRFDYEKDRVNRMGTRHVCVFDNETIEFETVTNDFGPNKLVYGERLNDYKFIKEATNYFILEEQDGQTLLT